MWSKHKILSEFVSIRGGSLKIQYWDSPYPFDRIEWKHSILCWGFAKQGAKCTYQFMHISKPGIIGSLRIALSLACFVLSKSSGILVLYSSLLQWQKLPKILHNKTEWKNNDWIKHSCTYCNIKGNESKYYYFRNERIDECIDGRIEYECTCQISNGIAKYFFIFNWH